MTSLLPITRQKIDKQCETLKREKLTPWLWYNSHGVKVNDFYGKAIDISGGSYGQSENVFWDFINPFLKDALVKTLDETLETCRIRELKPEEQYIEETAMLLDSFLIEPIYIYMAEIEQKIKGKGNPKSVRRRDVTEHIEEMRYFLNRSKENFIQDIKNKSQPQGNVVEEKKERKVKYKPELLQAMKKTFDEYSEQLGVIGAWNKVAEIFDLKSGKAAEMACIRAKKRNK